MSKAQQPFYCLVTTQYDCGNSMEQVLETLPPDFKSFIALYKERIYNAITGYLPEGEPAEHCKAVRSYVDRKGQYRRPSYLMLWNLLYGGKAEDAILPAAVQQLSEEWILMLDDWMDGNTLRRGAPAAHVLFGDRYAVNGASHLQAINWRMARDAANSLGKERGDRYFEKFYNVIDVTHRGQYIDMHLTHDVKDITKFTQEDYYSSIHAKSGYYSVYGPMQQGAIIAGASDAEVERIKEYGNRVGNAFQIKDDILDCTSTDEKLGKSVGNDVLDGVKTLILWHAVHNSDSTTLNRIKSIYMKDRGAKDKDDVKFVLGKFNELGSIDYAQSEADRFSNEATQHFDSLSSKVAPKLKDLARDSMGYATKRSN